jgi:hypothetical protein
MQITEEILVRRVVFPVFVSIHATLDTVRGNIPCWNWGELGEKEGFEGWI